MNKTILKQIIKQIIKESQEFKIPVIYPREIEIPLNSKKIVAVSGPSYRPGLSLGFNSTFYDGFPTNIRLSRCLIIFS